MNVCNYCRSGKHQHDRWTMTGADAGCPNVTPDGGECGCTFVVPARRPGRCPTCGHVQ